MTEQEKKELLDELEKRMDEKYKGCLTREDVATTLKAPREKWFRDENGNGRYSLMADAFDSTIISWQVWETIRKLTCVICGKQYVRQLANVENADEIAEKLCQFVYDLKMGFKNQEEETLKPTKTPQPIRQFPRRTSGNESSVIWKNSTGSTEEIRLQSG
ncbi:MAG: hypothetical protein MRZ75_06920 [Roseburia sp.]|nr:hypothetical protein [Roseburia sp.]